MLKFFGMKYTAAILSTNTRKLKINKSCCHQSCTFWLQYALNRLSAAGASSQIPLGELTALLRPPAGFRGPTSKGLGGEEESSSFAVERKSKVGAREHEIGHKTGTETRTNKNVANSTAYSVTDRQTDWLSDGWIDWCYIQSSTSREPVQDDTRRSLSIRHLSTTPCIVYDLTFNLSATAPSSYSLLEALSRSSPACLSTDILSHGVTLAPADNQTFQFFFWEKCPTRHLPFSADKLFRV